MLTNKTTFRVGFADRQYMLHLRTEFRIAAIVYQLLALNQS